MAEASTSALALAAKTIHFRFCASEAKSIVASWVLSPISARKTEMKIAEKALIMRGVYSLACGEGLQAGNHRPGYPAGGPSTVLDPSGVSAAQDDSDGRGAIKRMRMS